MNLMNNEQKLAPIVRLHQYTLLTPFGSVNIERVTEAMMREAEEENL